MAAWLLPAIEAATSVGSAIYNAVSGYNNQRYMKNMQEEAWNREDDAMQRRVADLRKAGLSPVLAAGGSGAASSAPINVGVPQFDDPKPIQTALALENQRKQNALTDAQMELVNTQIDATDANSFTARMFRDGLTSHVDKNGNLQEPLVKNRPVRQLVETEYDKQIALNKEAERSALDEVRNSDINRSFGIPTGFIDPTVVKTVMAQRAFKKEGSSNARIGSLLDLIHGAGSMAAKAIGGKKTFTTNNFVGGGR